MLAGDLDKPFGWTCQRCGAMLCHANCMCPVAVFCDSCHAELESERASK